jgi:hypothetical protein
MFRSHEDTLMKSKITTMLIAAALLGTVRPAIAGTIASSLLDVGNGSILYCWISNVGDTAVKPLAAQVFDRDGNTLSSSVSCFPMIPPGGSCAISAPTARARAVLEVKGSVKNLRGLCIMTDATDTPQASAEMR